jgi:hypothetical protein
MTKGTPDDPRFTAGIDLARRTGAKQLQIRYSDDEEPVIWFAVASYTAGKDGRPRTSGKINAHEVGAALHPLAALFRLLDTLVDGSECAHCHRPAGFVEDTSNMPLDRVVCWYIYDPETQKYMRGCEAMDG